MAKKMMLAVAMTAMLASCVSTKKFKLEQARYTSLDSSYRAVQSLLTQCRDDQDAAARRRAQLEADLDATNKQIAFMKENNNAMVNQLKDLSVISSSQAES